MKIFAAILSGAFAALASVCGKFAFDDHLDLVLRGLAFGGLLGCNAFMLKYFVFALRDAGSVIGTTVNASANVAVSALIGAIVFGESDKLTWKWFAGACLALLGMYCIHRGTNVKKETIATDELPKAKEGREKAD